MNAKEIQDNLNRLVESLNSQEFIYDFLLAYGISKTSITRLKKGDYNLSKVEGEVLYKNKVFFKTEKAEKLLIAVEEASKNERILKQNPRFVITTDFEMLVARDLKKKTNLDIKLAELSKQYLFFQPLAGGEAYKASNDNEADRKAAYKLGELYDILVTANPDYNKESHNLNVFLARLLFCFFAEDTGIFKKESIFTETLAQRTAEDGSDVHLFLQELFIRLSTEAGTLPDYLKDDFPYVNGGLFNQVIEPPRFTRTGRDILLACGDLDWSEINPDIFGSMIQAVADPEERSDLGMHYTSVPNIRKLIDPLFLNSLKEEFEKAANNATALRKLKARMGKMKFFDPACGSGNFLIINYKELRLLEIEIIRRIVELEKDNKQREIFFTEIRLQQFYGIEIKDFAHEMAVLSLWLAEHQMNKVFDFQLEGNGQSAPILPLKQAGKIVCANAARESWETVCPKNKNDEIYVLGNPPYLGKSLQNNEQKTDMELCFSSMNSFGNLDYISIWFYKGAKYIEQINAQLAFVSTNSISQGEQVAQIWPKLLNGKVEISFAHTSFKWTNNAKGNAGVTVVIIGLRNMSASSKYLFNTLTTKASKSINAYLIDGPEIIVFGRSTPLSNFLEMTSGSKITDDGNLILGIEKDSILSSNKNANDFIKKFIGAQEFIEGTFRSIIYVPKAKVKEAYCVLEFADRFRKVAEFRSKSQKLSTQKKASSPHFFDEDKHRYAESIVVPRHSSENRDYIPMGLFSDDTIIGDSALVIYDAEFWLFGVLHSRMHMVWVNTVGGKLKTDYRYSAKLCYNTFPFPDINSKQKETITQYVFAVLDERAKYPEKTMAWLYNPGTMPKELKQAHKELDTAVEQIYRLAPFQSDAERLEYLFKLYEEMTNKDTLFAKQKKPRKKKEEIAGE